MDRKIGTFGVVLIVLGVLAGLYTITTPMFWGLFSVVSSPYAAFMIPLIIIGVIVVVFGISSRRHVEEEASHHYSSQSMEVNPSRKEERKIRYCSECGKPIDKSNKFCSECGIKQ